jgi:hypothetical protein
METDKTAEMGEGEEEEEVPLDYNPDHIDWAAMFLK